MSEEKNMKRNVSRRDFFKFGGFAGAALSMVGVAGAGFAQAKDFDTYTGWEDNNEGGAQFFNREPFRVNKPTYEVVGETRRIDNRVEGRAHFGVLADAREAGWKKEDGIDALPEPLRSFYQENPESLELALLRQDVLEPQQRENRQKYDLRFALAMAWADAWGAVQPDRPNAPPEEWDFRDMREEAFVFKSEDHAAELIKKSAHTFGATLVGITKLNPDWVYQYELRGSEDPGAYDVPEWWEYAIVVTTPHEWDQMLANPTYGTSSDAYARSSIAGARLAAFIRSLGYPARLHSPRNGYDLVVPPIVIDAGLGEQGRHVYSITPELGSNHRPAVVTTSLPMTIDKPVDLGIMEFCKDCKICADYCPSGSISFEDEPTTVVRGYKRWELNTDTCYNFWGQVLGNGGCRTCLAVCPYSRKNNWVHQMGRTVSAYDPTGMVDTGLIWMQENFFEYPDAQDYYPPPDGVNASFREGPEWMQIERWFDVHVTW